MTANVLCHFMTSNYSTTHYRVKRVTLCKDLIERAVSIGKITSPTDQEEEAAKFLKAVPHDFSCVPFGVGGWFQATTKCTSSTEFSVDEAHEAAAKRNDNSFSAHCGLGIATPNISLSAGPKFAWESENSNASVTRDHAVERSGNVTYETCNQFRGHPDLTRGNVAAETNYGEWTIFPVLPGPGARFPGDILY